MRLLFFLLLLISCGKSGEIFVGTWTLTYESSSGPLTVEIQFSPSGSYSQRPDDKCTRTYSVLEVTQELIIEGTCEGSPKKDLYKYKCSSNDACTLNQINAETGVLGPTLNLTRIK